MNIDHLTRGVLTTDRRQALAGLIAGVTAPVFGVTPVAAAKQKGKQGKKRCHQEQKHCRAQVAAFCAQGADPPECEEDLLPCCATCKVGAGVLCAAALVSVC